MKNKYDMNGNLKQHDAALYAIRPVIMCHIIPNTAQYCCSFTPNEIALVDSQSYCVCKEKNKERTRQADYHGAENTDWQQVLNEHAL